MSTKMRLSNNALTHLEGSDERFKMTFDFDSSVSDESTMVINGNIIPTIDDTFQLGSGDKRWSSVYIDDTTIYMGNDGLLTTVNEKMVIRNRKDGNLFPPPLWHQKHALFKYGIQTSIQKDDVTRKTRNYIGTITYDEKVGNYSDSTPDTIVIQDNSNTAEDEEDNFYKDWYIDTYGTVSGTSTRIYGKISAYTASTKTLSISTWYSDVSHSTNVNVTNISTSQMFNLKTPAAYSSKTQSTLDEFQVSGTIETVTSQSLFILSATTGTLSTINNTYNKIYRLKVTKSGIDYYAKVISWTADTNTIGINSVSPWKIDLSLNISPESQPNVSEDDVFVLVAIKIRLLDLNIEKILNILEQDVPNAQDYKKYDAIGSNLAANQTSFKDTFKSAWDDGYVYDQSGKVISTYDSETETFKTGNALDFYSNDFNVSSGYSTTAIGDNTTFRSINISQSSITTDQYNTIEVILPSNDTNSLSPSTDYSNYELQLEDTTGNIEFHIVASSTSVNISGTDHVKIKVDYPFYTKPTSSFKYQLTGYIDTYTDTGNDTGFSNTNQTDNVTSLNYQIKLDNNSIAVDDYYNDYKITVEVYDSSNYTSTSIYGTITDYDGSTKVATISSSTYGSGIQWTDASNNSQANVKPASTGYDYYYLEQSSGTANYQTNYYSSGTIVYDPVKTFQDASYSTLSAATSAGMDPQLYKYMKTIENDADALNFDQFDASNSVAYNWSDYFYDSKSWYGSLNTMYTNDYIYIGTKEPPSGTKYCNLNVYGSSKNRLLISVPENTTDNNTKKITEDYRNKGYVFAKGLYIGNQDLSSTTLLSSDISLSEGDIAVKGSASIDGGLTTGTLSMSSGSITDTSGSISFGDENLMTTGQMTAAQYNMNSDRHLKKDIEELINDEEQSASVLKLNPVSFKWKDEFSKNENTQYGLIAQEVEKIYPNLVEKDNNSNLTVNYIGLIPLMLSQMKKMNEIIQKLTE